MKKVALLLCALGLLAVPACKRKDADCGSCHEKRVKHDCHKGHCSFFGRCAEDAERDGEEHRYDDEK